MAEWNDGDAASLKRFLDSHPGFLKELETRLPEIETKGSMEVGAMSGARHAGAKDMLKAISDMSQDSGEVRSDSWIDPSKD